MDHVSRPKTNETSAQLVNAMFEVLEGKHEIAVKLMKDFFATTKNMM